MQASDIYAHVKNSVVPDIIENQITFTRYIYKTLLKFRSGEYAIHYLSKLKRRSYLISKLHG